VKWRDDVDRQLVVAAERPIIEIARKSVVLRGRLVTDLAALDDAVENQRLQFLGDLGRVDLDRLDLLFDVLFLIGQELVQFAIALDVGVLLKQTERLIDPPLVFRQVGVEPLQHQDRDVAGRGLEGFDVFHQKQRLQNPRGELVTEVLLSDQNRLLDIRFERGADALEHLIEGREPADRKIREPDRDLLEDAQHRPLTDRAVLSLESIVLGQVLDRQLEQRILVRNKGIAVNEMIAVAEVFQPN